MTLEGTGFSAPNLTDADRNSAGMGGKPAFAGSNGSITLYWGASVTSISPQFGVSSGGDTVSIYGSGFSLGATVTIGGSPCTNVSVQSSIQLTCTVSAGSLGTADVVVTTSGFSAVTLSNGYTYATCTHSSQIINSTGALQFLTPSSFSTCSTMTVKIWGAGGGGSFGAISVGGGGGYATGTFSIIPGQVFTLLVGSGGAPGTNAGSATLNSGGYGGGGNGYGNNAAGGGRSAIQLSGTDVLTAGGGGGGGNSASDRSGGAGGGTSASAGVGDNTSGQAGTQTFGGAAIGGSTGTGFPGTQFTGGNGNISLGAGGGGGYNGGGGSGQSPGDVGGGGGGSSFVSQISGATTIAGFGSTQGNSTDPDCAGAGAGGAVGSGGANGLIVVSW
jgi:hypothetical protein